MTETFPSLAMLSLGELAFMAQVAKRLAVRPTGLKAFEAKRP